MMIRAHAAMSAKGRLEPFEDDPDNSPRALEHTRSGKARFPAVLVA